MYSGVDIPRDKQIVISLTIFTESEEPLHLKF